MTRRERVLEALSFKETDRPPMDLGGMLSTGISAFAYPGLVRALGLPARRPRVADTYQMLALPDMDVLDALDCDVVAVFMHWGVTNAFEQPDPLA
jgi:uroporphyrinogen decarboxylase